MLVVIGVILTFTLVGCFNGLQKFKLTINIQGEGTIIKDPNQSSYEKDTKVKLKAEAKEGWVFDHWEGSLTGSTNPSTVVISDGMTIKAVFVEETTGIDNETEYTSNNSSSAHSNNSAILTTDGFTLGEGTTDISLLRKKVPTNLVTSNNIFSVGQAYLLKSDVDSTYVYLAIPITNISNEDYCFIDINNLIGRDSNGQQIYQEEYSSYVTGSVGVSPNSVTTDTSLFAGETGYLLEIIDKDIYSDLAQIELGGITGDLGVTKPEAKLIPRSLQYTKYDYYESLTVSVNNEGTKRGYMDDLHFYILLDDNEEPLDWGFLGDNLQPSDGYIDIGEAGSISDKYFNYSGSANKLIMFVDFEDELTTSSSLSVSSFTSDGLPLSPEGEKEILDYRNQREREKQELLN